MLRQIRLQNYRCFEDHTILFEPITVVVGKNNAGKSSLIEALRLVGTAVNRNSATFVPAPKWLRLPRFQMGLAPGISQLGIDLSAVFHRYGEPPAIIEGKFEGGTTVTVYVGREEKVFATIEHKSDMVDSNREFLALNIPRVEVMPQINPLLTEEYRLADDRIAGNLTSRLSSRHFRNQLMRMDDNFADFKRLAEETWHGLRIDPVQQTATKDGPQLSLNVRDGDFVAEVGWMGHGLQMWLQTIWFLSKISKNCTVVLDEPDIYMHPDLQRKVFRLTCVNFHQSIVATHSVEIMAESEPSNILIIDKKKRRSKYADDEPGVQALIDQIGGIHNIHLARLWSARKFLMVEGKDVALLKKFHALLFPDAELPIDAIPSLAVGGWGGWTSVRGSSMTLKNAVGDRVVRYCILDSDYHSEEEIRERYDESKAREVNLHVWSRKEIENYLVVPKAIRRLLVFRSKAKEAPTEEEIRSKILDICDKQKDAVLDAMASAMIQTNRKIDVATANQTARKRLDEIWKTEENRANVVSGKTILAGLSEWSQDNFGTTFGPPAVSRFLGKSDLPEEMIEVLTAIEDGSEFVSFEERSDRYGVAG